MALAQPYAERLAEDERLRGSLSDVGFGPVLSWVTELLTAAAQRATTERNAGSMMEQAGDVALDLVRGVVAAAESGQTGDLAAALRPPLLTADEATRARSAIPAAFARVEDPDAQARAIVSALTAVAPGTSEAGA